MEDTAPKYMIADGRMQPASPQAGPYVFQNVHTLGYRCRNMRRHIEILDSAARRLFGVKHGLTTRDAEQHATRLLEACGMSRNVTVRIMLKVYPTGLTVMECDEASIYSGYVLRSLRPEAVCMAITPPMPEYPTSAMEQTRAMTDAIARTRGFHTAILTDAGGNVVSECTQPLFTVHGYMLTTPPIPAGSAELEAAEAAAHKAELTVQKRPLTLGDLASADEVFTVNFQGVTSISRIDSKPYMSIIAGRIAEEMEPAKR